MKNYTNEEWRDAVGYEGLYQVSTWGQIKSLERIDSRGNRVSERILKPAKDKGGYLHVVLYKDGKSKPFKVHRLVGIAFADLIDWTADAKGKPFEELEINHKKEGLKEKANNHVECLEWCDRKYNIKYGTGIERRAKAKINGKRSKRVAQKTLDGELVKIWPSASEVQRQTGWGQGNISKCCCNKYKQAYGFIWQFVN